MLAAHLLVEIREHFFQALDVPPCLLEMRLERRPQTGGAGGLRHLGKCLRELLLRVVHITQFIDKRIM